MQKKQIAAVSANEEEPDKPEKPDQDEQERKDHLALRGGLKGRLAAEFAVLQSSMDALRRYTQNCMDHELVAVTEKMLHEMALRVASIERLADNAAELAISVAMCGMQEKRTMELCDYIREFCACAEEELLRCDRPMRVTMHLDPGAPCQKNTAPDERTVWVKADGGLVNALLVNLLSNSAKVKECTEVAIRLTADRKLIYSDNGPGLPENCRLILQKGHLTGELLSEGKTGLLLVREYAGALGWKIDVAGENKAEIAFSLPDFDAQEAMAATASLCSGRENKAEKTRLHAGLRRELAATLHAVD